MGSDIYIDVSTGQVEFAQGKGVLVSNAIGSCIAVTMYCRPVHAGGIAHVMLPWNAPEGCPENEKLRYAGNAIEFLVNSLKSFGSRKNDIRTCLIGGGNVLKKDDDTICACNIASVSEILEKMKIRISFKSLGGTVRRRVRLDVAVGKFYYSEGDGEEIAVECE